MFGLDPSWILPFRSEQLTTAFKVIPIFSNYFFFMAIALGYWLRPKNTAFTYLGFLIPVSIIFNVLLKNIFHVSRPPLELHLVSVHEHLGYPSGEVQIATVFWLMIALSLSKRWRPLCILPIVAVALSRVYLGVHSIEDVIAGLLFGLATVLLWQSVTKKYSVKELLNFFNSKAKHIFLGLAIVLGILITTPNYVFIPTLPLAVGILAGWCWSLTAMMRRLAAPDYAPSTARKIIGCVVGVALLILFKKLFSPFGSEPIFLSCSICLQSWVLSKMLYGAVPECLGFQRYR